MSNPCEWNPTQSIPASSIPVVENGKRVWRNYRGCPNDATLIVGAEGQWRLCQACSELPEFRRFKVRRPFKPERARLSEETK